MLNLLQQRKGHLCSVHGMAKSRCIPPISTICFLLPWKHRCIGPWRNQYKGTTALPACCPSRIVAPAREPRVQSPCWLLNPVDFPAMPLTGRFQQRHKKGIGWPELIAQYFLMSVHSWKPQHNLTLVWSTKSIKILPTCPCAAHANLPDFHQLPL